MTLQRKAVGSDRPVYVEPPPVPLVPPRLQQNDRKLPNEVLFTDGLIRFLIVNLSLLVILLAANVLVLLRAESIQLGRTSVEIEASGSKNISGNPDETSKGEITRIPITDAPVTALMVADGPAPDVLPEPESNKSAYAFDASTFDVSTHIAPETEWVTWGPPLPRRNSESPAINPANQRSFEEADSQIDKETSAENNQREVDQEAFTAKRPSFLMVLDPDRKNHCTPASIKMEQPFYGTKIKWNRQVDDAASQARQEDKLVFLMHVSGNFTKEEFT